MDSRLDSPLESNPHSPSPPVPPDPPPQNVHHPSSDPIPPPQGDPDEEKELLKHPSNLAHTSSGYPLQPASSPSPSRPQSQPIQGQQASKQKNAQKQPEQIQSDQQNSQNLNEPSPPLPQSQPSKQKDPIPQHQFSRQKKQLQQRSSPKKRKNRNNCFYDQEADSQEAEEAGFKFPFINEYLLSGSNECLNTLHIFDKSREELGKIASNSYINCDVRYFNWQLFAEQVGKFDVVLIDPPWRIKGAQQNDSQFMFSNCKFSLEYNTMANSQIGRIPLNLLSDQGFIFLWILNSQLDASLEIMEQWGYELVEEIVWVKLKDEKISLTHGYYFMHSFQACLVGYKCKKEKKNKEEEDRLKVRKGISWNTVFAQVREKSQKPEDIYSIIDIMFKGNKKIQIFARNHNLRFGIFSIGNELGQSYDKWLLKLECDQCRNPLQIGNKRYKSKKIPNYDLCHKCVQHKQKGQFFQLANNIDQNIKHEYISCNNCGSQPIWGIRFQCITCQDFDICQNCFDKNLQEKTNFHSVEHQFMFLEVPVFGNGFHIHESKCASCYQNPIIGIYFSCTTCKNLNLCQKCYFQRPATSQNGLMRRHKPEHQLQAILQSQISDKKKYECFSCKRQILQQCYMCQNCYNFFFCNSCYTKRDEFKSLYANTHKKYHVLTQIF